MNLIRPLRSRAGTGLFLYLAPAKDGSSLAPARRHLQTIADNLEL